MDLGPDKILKPLFFILYFSNINGWLPSFIKQVLHILPFI